MPNQLRAFVILRKPSQAVRKRLALCRDSWRESKLLSFFREKLVLIDRNVVLRNIKNC